MGPFGSTGPFRLVVRTSLFQGGNTGSIPVRDRMAFWFKTIRYSFNRKIHRFFVFKYEKGELKKKFL